jgi:hypothetical protein
MFLIRVLASIVCSMGSALVGLVSVRMDIPTTNARNLDARFLAYWDSGSCGPSETDYQ